MTETETEIKYHEALGKLVWWGLLVLGPAFVVVYNLW